MRLVIAEFIATAFCRLATSACGMSEEPGLGVLADGDGQHPLCGVETKCEVSGTGIAEPEMLTMAKLPPVAVKRGV